MRAFVKASIYFAVLLIVAYGLFLGLDAEDFRVSGVSFELMEDRDPSYLFPKIKADLEPRVAGLVGRFIWDIDLESLVESLEKDRRLKDLKVVRRWPNEIKVELRPQTAVANIMSDRSDLIYPLASDGTVFPAMALDEVTDAPILRGTIFLKNKDVRDQALQILALLPQEGPFATTTISEVDFDKAKGFVLVVGPDGSQVILGHEDFAKRIGYVSRVLRYLRTEKLENRTIDSRFQKKVVVRPRNAS